MKALDVAHINPFLQSSQSVIEMATQIKVAAGEPGIAKLNFQGTSIILGIGVTGALKGQVLIVMTEEHAKIFASKMMRMPIEVLDEMAISALCELSNMIMGNTATLFASNGIAMDITPPFSMQGDNITLQTDVQAFRVPMLENGTELFALYLCVGQE